MLPYQLTNFAVDDLDHILQYTIEHYGEKQMLKYNAQLVSGFEEISKISGLYRTINRKGKLIRSIHCQKHYIFAVERLDQPTLIIAILHEKMNLIERIKKRL